MTETPTSRGVESPGKVVALGGAFLLALPLVTLFIPLGGIERAGADPLSLVLWGAVVVLAAVAGYVGSWLGAAGFAAAVGLAGPQLAHRLGPTPDEGFIPLLSLPVLLVPVLLLPGLVGILVRLWR